MVPGSHKLISEVGAGNPVGPLPPAINAECPAGTVVMFEGRLLHGTGVNKTDRPRRMYVGNSLKPNFRQQEIWTLSLKPEVLSQLTTKMAYRMGLHPMGLGGVEGDWVADLRYWRTAMDDGTYCREYCCCAHGHIDNVGCTLVYNYAVGLASCAQTSRMSVLCRCTDLRNCLIVATHQVFVR